MGYKLPHPEHRQRVRVFAVWVQSADENKKHSCYNSLRLWCCAFQSADQYCRTTMFLHISLTLDQGLWYETLRNCSYCKTSDMGQELRSQSVGSSFSCKCFKTLTCPLVYSCMSVCWHSKMEVSLWHSSASIIIPLFDHLPCPIGKVTSCDHTPSHNRVHAGSECWALFSLIGKALWWTRVAEAGRKLSSCYSPQKQRSVCRCTLKPNWIAPVKN